jgi:hypothetical protein
MIPDVKQRLEPPKRREAKFYDTLGMRNLKP